MLRIGIAASKMSKGSLLSYNFYVILITCLVSLLVFFICGFSILLIIFLTYLAVHALRPAEFQGHWVHMVKISLIMLAVVIGIFNVIAICKNLQLTKKKV